MDARQRMCIIVVARSDPQSASQVLVCWLATSHVDNDIMATSDPYGGHLDRVSEYLPEVDDSTAAAAAAVAIEPELKVEKKEEVYEKEESDEEEKVQPQGSNSSNSASST